MKINPDQEKPIFIQIAEGIEDGILTGAFPEGSQIPSITEFSVNYKINPATALKGINLLVVKVETSEPGLYGLGCGTFAYRHLAVKMVVEEYLRPLLIGRDVSDINDIWQLMHQNGYWRNGPIENNAISGVDMALWDLLGQKYSAPVYRMLGGARKNDRDRYHHQRQPGRRRWPGMPAPPSSAATTA